MSFFNPLEILFVIFNFENSINFWPSFPLKRKIWKNYICSLSIDSKAFKVKLWSHKLLQKTDEKLKYNRNKEKKREDRPTKWCRHKIKKGNFIATFRCIIGAYQCNIFEIFIYFFFVETHRICIFDFFSGLTLNSFLKKIFHFTGCLFYVVFIFKFIFFLLCVSFGRKMRFRAFACIKWIITFFSKVSWREKIRLKEFILAH